MTLTSLSQAMPRDKQLTSYELWEQQRILPSVYAIVSYHDLQARTEGGNAIFGLIDRDKDVPIVGAITGRIVWGWERACAHFGRELPFSNLPRDNLQPSDLESEDVQLVIETAAAVCEVLQAGLLTSQLDFDRRRELTRFIRRRGPTYAKAWIRGDIIRDYCDQQGYDAEFWLWAVPREERIRLALADSDHLLIHAKEIVVGRLKRRFRVGLGAIAIQMAEFHENAPVINPQPEEPTPERQDVFDDWLDSREQHRRQLFGPRLSGEPAPLATVAFNTYLAGATKKIEEIQMRYREGLPNIIAEVLTFHNNLALGAKDGLALFGIKDPHLMDIVTLHTAKIIWLWERTCIRVNRHSLFAELPHDGIRLDHFERRDVQLVVETASAVCEVLQAGYPTGDTPGLESTHLSKLSQLIAEHGPEFAKAWMRGEIIRAYCERNGYDADRWLGLLSPSLRAVLAVHNLRDPLRKLFLTMGHFEHTIPPERIQQLTGWEPHKVNAAFPTNARMVLAMGSNPLWAVQQIAKRIDEDLTTDNLVEKLGLSQKRVDKVFTPARRYAIARDHQKPVPKARHYVRLHTILKEDFGIYDNLAIHAAFNFGSSCIERTIQVLAQRSLRPESFSPTLWDTVVMYYPQPKDPRRTKYMQRYFNKWSIEHPLPLDMTFDDSSRSAAPQDTTADRSVMDPGDIVTEDIPGEVLERIAEKAEVSAEQVGDLIAHFRREGSAIGLSPELRALLEKLQRAARPTAQDEE